MLKKFFLVLSFIIILFEVYKVAEIYTARKTSIPSIAKTEVVPSPTEIPTPTPVNLSADKLFQLVNDWRVQNGYQPYIKSDFDCKIAEGRLPEVKIVWSHAKFLSDAQAGKYCSDCYLGENLAKGYSTEEDALNAWLNSPSHLANLKRTYDHTCIVTDGDYAVEIFSYF